MWIVFTFRKTISNYLDKLSEKNANLICLFPQDLKNFNHIYSNHVGEDMSKEEFRKFCLKCWKKPHGFAVIDLTSKKMRGSIEMGSITFLYPNNKWKIF